MLGADSRGRPALLWRAGRSRVRPALLWRAGLVAAVVVAALLAAPDAVLRVGALVCIGLAAERLARRRGRGLLDALVLAGGGLLAGLVLLGLLGGGPWGFSTRGWTIGIGLAALVALAAAAGPPVRTPAVPPGGGREVLRAAPWVAVSLVVAAMAVGLSSRSAERAVPVSTAPTGLSMAFGAVSGTTVDVVVTAPGGQPGPGPYALKVTVGSTEITYPVFTPTAGQPHTSRVSVPMTGRFAVALVDPEDGTVVRTLMIAR